MNKPFGVIINQAGLGNNNVQQYLWDEGISLLLEIPFKKEIAGIYSKGEIVSEKDLFFAKQLNILVENIILKHGNSSH